MINIRLATINDLNELNNIQFATTLHLSRLKKQKSEKANYIIAFDNNKPVGHLFIDYKSKYSWHKNPVIMDLYVAEDERKKGIATKLMNYAESLIKKRGFDIACLDVEINNLFVKRFYEKMGYKMISGPHNLIYIEHDNNNKKVTEVVVHLVKNI